VGSLILLSLRGKHVTVRILIFLKGTNLGRRGGVFQGLSSDTPEGTTIIRLVPYYL